MGKTQLRGPQRAGSTVLDEGRGGALTRMVVDSYGGASREEAREGGQAAAAAILPLRRELWRLAERLVPRRLAAALRARLSTADPTGRDGVRELRAAIADWLDPPPRCRRCGRAMRPDASAEDRTAACPATGTDGDARLRRFARDLQAAGERVRAARSVGHQPDLQFAPAEEMVPSSGPIDHRGRKNSQVPRPRPWPAPPRRPERSRRWAATSGWSTFAATTTQGRRGASDSPGPSGPPRPCIPVTERAMGRRGRCGTLALLSAGAASLEVMAAALACPRGAAAGYDVAADRDCRALLAATRPRDVQWDRMAAPDYAFANDPAAALFAAVRGAAGQTERPLPAQLLAARAALQSARDANLRANGRLGLGVQARYYSPDAGAMRADLVQGAAIGVDRAGLDFDAARGFRFSTYGAEWARQGCGEAFSGRDLVDTPAWILDLRREVEMRLRRAAGDQGGSAAIVRELLLAIEGLAEAPAPAAACRLALLCLAAEVTIPAGSRGRGSPALRVSVHGQAGTPGHRLARLALEAADPSRPANRQAAGKAPKRAGAKRPAVQVDENPERARERVAAWVASVGLGLQKVSGAGLLAALRHGCPVFVPVGSGDERDDDAAQGGAGGGGGGQERAAHIIAAPDDHAQAEDEQEDAVRWSRALAALATMRAGAGDADGFAGREAAEVVRRHHGLDGAREDSRGGGQGGGESFQAIADSGLRSTGRRPCKEVVRRIYLRAIEALRRTLANGEAAEDVSLHVWEEDADLPRPSTRSPWKPLRPASVVTTTNAPALAVRETTSAEDFDAFREAAASVTW